MTASRRTPRYVEIIGPEPMGPQRMGPHPVADHPRPAPARGGESRFSQSGVLPLRPHLSTYAPPPPAVEVTPVTPLPVAPARPRGRVVPVERRPLRVLIVSSEPGAAPRSFLVRRWQARVAIAAVSLALLLGLGVVAAVVVAVRAPDLFTDGAEVSALRSELASTQDSLAMMRASLAAVSATESGDAGAEGAAAVTPAPAAAAPPVSTPRPAADRPKPLRARTSRVNRSKDSESSLLASMPRSLSELPVIGALVSGFSLARRHPLLHVTRPHLGVDVAAPRGTRVSAPAPGRVRFVGRRIGFGLVVELDHGDGVTTRYAHLRSAAVDAGEQVTKGEAIAAVGTSGITTGPHLHYEVLVHGRQVDPLRYRFPGAEPAPAPVQPAAAAVVASPAPIAPMGGAVMGTHDNLAPAPR